MKIVESNWEFFDAYLANKLLIWKFYKGYKKIKTWVLLGPTDWKM